MTAQWIPGAFLALFVGSTWLRRGYMVTYLPVRGMCSPGDEIEMHWPGGDSIRLAVKEVNIETNYTSQAIESAHREGIPLRIGILVEDPTDARLNFRRGHFFVLAEDAERFPPILQPWVHVAPPGILLAAPGALTPDKLKALPPPEARDYHNLVKLVTDDVL